MLSAANNVMSRKNDTQHKVNRSEAMNVKNTKKTGPRQSRQQTLTDKKLQLRRLMTRMI
jgi:hypothetical protein